MYHFRLKWKRYTVCTNCWDNFFGVGLPLFPVGLLLFARWESLTSVFKILVRALSRKDYAKLKPCIIYVTKRSENTLGQLDSGADLTSGRVDLLPLAQMHFTGLCLNLRLVPIIYIQWGLLPHTPAALLISSTPDSIGTDVNYGPFSPNMDIVEN